MLTGQIPCRHTMVLEPPHLFFLLLHSSSISCFIPSAGVYAHPNMATTPGTVQANTDSEVKATEGKERSSARKSRAIIERNVRENGVTTYLSELLERRCLEQSTHIIKMPFRTEKGAVRKWISRFEVRPYMETFTERRHCWKVQEPYSFTFKES